MGHAVSTRARVELLPGTDATRCGDALDAGGTMTVRIVRLPDVGEGVAEAELVAWHVAVGDAVTSDTVVAEVLTDKATVEIYAPVAGTVTVLHGAPGDVLAVGSDFIGIETGAGSEPVVDDVTPAV